MQQFNALKLQELDHLFRKTVRRFVKERDKITIQGVSLPSMMILRKIFIYGEQRLSDLAEEMDLTSGAITAQCDKLEEQGLAERIRYKEDRRTIYLQITAQGGAFVACYNDIGHVHASIVFEDFTEAELEQQFVIYQKLINNLQGLSDKLLTAVKINQQQTQVMQQAKQSLEAAELANEEQTMKAAGLTNEEQSSEAAELANEEQMVKAAEKPATEAIAEEKLAADAVEKQAAVEAQRRSVQTVVTDAERASAQTATDEQRGRWLSY